MLVDNPSGSNELQDINARIGELTNQIAAQQVVFDAMLSAVHDAVKPLRDEYDSLIVRRDALVSRPLAAK